MNIIEQLELEHSQLLTPSGPQRHKLLPGVTREQAVRFYARREAVARAITVNINTDIDKVIASGHVEVRVKGRWISLWNPDTGTGYQYGDKVSRDYIYTVLNQGNMARNY